MYIRNEEPRDHKAVEALTRRAFYNLYVPGCVEHYLARIMREHEDFIPELDFVLEEDGRIIGNIMYTRARLVDEAGREKEILTFGPVCVEPELQRQGYGKALMEYSFARAKEYSMSAFPYPWRCSSGSTQTGPKVRISFSRPASSTSLALVYMMFPMIRPSSSRTKSSSGIKSSCSRMMRAR